MDQGELEGMPEPAALRLATSDGQVLVTWGQALVYRYEVEDIGMRNLAIVALTDAGRRVDEVARVFDLTATYVSMLRGRARLKGSAGLVRRRGRPRKLSDRQVAQARAWAGSGWTQQAISERLGVARSVISDLLARVGPAPVQESLPATSSLAPTVAEPDDTETTETETETGADPVVPPAGSARIKTGTCRCRYAGAMMLYPYHLRRRDDAVSLSAPGRRPSDLRDVDWRSGAPVRRPWRVDHRDPRFRVGRRHRRRDQTPTSGRGRRGGRPGAHPGAGDVAGPGRRVRPPSVAAGVCGRDAGGRPRRRCRLLRRRPFRGLRRRPSGRQR